MCEVWVNNLETENKRLCAKIDKVAAKNAELESKNEELKSENTRLSEENTKLKADNERMKSNLTQTSHTKNSFNSVKCRRKCKP